VGVPKRFLFNTELESADAPIVLIQNWQPGSKRWLRAGDQSSLVG
jgi:hypothetical protein